MININQDITNLQVQRHVIVPVRIAVLLVRSIDDLLHSKNRVYSTQTYIFEDISVSILEVALLEENTV